MYTPSGVSILPLNRVPVEIMKDGTLRLALTGWMNSAPRHERDFRITADGVEIFDRVAVTAGRVTSRLLLAPGWSLEEAEGGFVARHAATALAVQILLPTTFKWSVESAPFYPTFHEEAERSVLVGRGETPVDSLIRIRSLRGST